LSCLIQGDAAWHEQAKSSHDQAWALNLTVWQNDCFVTVNDLCHLPLAKLTKLYMVCTQAGQCTNPSRLLTFVLVMGACVTDWHHFNTACICRVFLNIDNMIPSKENAWNPTG